MDEKCFAVISRLFAELTGSETLQHVAQLCEHVGEFAMSTRASGKCGEPTTLSLLQQVLHVWTGCLFLLGRYSAAGCVASAYELVAFAGNPRKGDELNEKVLSSSSPYMSQIQALVDAGSKAREKAKRKIRLVLRSYCKSQNEERLVKDEFCRTFGSSCRLDLPNFDEHKNNHLGSLVAEAFSAQKFEDIATLFVPPSWDFHALHDRFRISDEYLTAAFTIVETIALILPCDGTDDDENKTSMLGYAERIFLVDKSVVLRVTPELVTTLSGGTVESFLFAENFVKEFQVCSVEAALRAWSELHCDEIFVGIGRLWYEKLSSTKRRNRKRVDFQMLHYQLYNLAEIANNKNALQRLEVWVRYRRSNSVRSKIRENFRLCLEERCNIS